MNKRETELTNNMTACNKERYYKSELLPEYLLLQQQIVNLTFNEGHAENAQLRISDVLHYLKQKLADNHENGETQEHQEFLSRLEDECKEFEILIKREIAGTSGERRVQKDLEGLTVEHVKTFNVELKKEDAKGELDAVIITKKGGFLLEVKNPGSDMVIDSRGNYYRARGRMDMDYNIGEKVNNKLILLRNALSEVHTTMGKQMKIVPLVVFANSKVHVKNRYKYVQDYARSELPYFINEYKGEDWYTGEELELIERTLKAADCKETYSVEFDFYQLKKDIAMAIALVEKLVKQEEISSVELITEKKTISAKQAPSKEKATEKTESKWNVAGCIQMAAGFVGAFGLGFLAHKVYTTQK